MSIVQNGFLHSGHKGSCMGCEACVQVCPKQALSMQEDHEGFRYPVLNKQQCISCGRCYQVCPYENPPHKCQENKYVFGGYHKDEQVRFNSTSGGAFTAIVDAFCDENYVIFGAQAKGLHVFHSYITDKKELAKFRKSKYSQSIIGNSYQQCKSFLLEGKKVLFSGTPCQIAGLRAFLGKINQEKLLTVEVICEGLPSPLYVRKLEKHLNKKYGATIEDIDYRYTGRGILSKCAWDFEKMLLKLKSWGGIVGKWDFQVTRITLMNKKILIKDRWFNPFWSIWLQHLMSRPSCYQCQFTTPQRGADITLGDLWGVHLYCPELYGKNGGSSLVICNTLKGKDIFQKAQENMYGHELRFEDALKYQGPLKKAITSNPLRATFMKDLQSEMEYKALTCKWAKKPTLKLLFSKYIIGKRPWIWRATLRNILKGDKNA